MLSILFYAISETTIVGLSIIKKTKYLMLSSLLSFVINIIANVIVVPFWGAKGAAVSTAISFFAFLILRTEFSSYFWIKIKRIKLYTISMLWLIISILYCFYGDKYIG
ncbi:polysaccharide biosynthesis C-terminal domain-containing protein, partial [Escherichia coli]